MNRTLAALLLGLALAGCGGGGGGGASSKAVYGDLTSASGEPFPWDLSADGSTVVGYSQAGDVYTPLVWKGLGRGSSVRASGEPQLQYFVGVSDNGRKLLGIAKQSGGTSVPVLSSNAGALTVLALPTGATSGYPIDLSGDGSTALCTDQPQTTPFEPKPYWVKNGVATYLPLPSGATTAFVKSISQDGSTVVGSVAGKPVRWVNGGAAESLGADSGIALAASGDGSVVVGLITSTTLGTRPFRWTAADGVKILPLDANFPSNGVAEAVSEDGKTVLMDASDTAQTQQNTVFLWKEGVGTRSLTSLIAVSGGNASGFDRAMGVALSADGRTVLGKGKRTSSGIIVSPWKLTLR